MDDKKGAPQYRCQRCAATVFNPTADLVPFKTLEMFAANPLASICNDTRRVLVHECEDGGAGFAIIIGMMPEEQIMAFRKDLATAAKAEEEARKNQSKSASN